MKKAVVVSNMKSVPIYAGLPDAWTRIPTKILKFNLKEQAKKNFTELKI